MMVKTCPRNQDPRSPKKQAGVALILALMISALVTVIAVEMTWRFDLSISRSANRLYGVQAKAYTEGAEHMAMVFLKEDAEGEDTGKVDNLGEAWAQETEPFPTDDGWVSGRIEDAHGRFNLNRMMPETDCPGDKEKTENGICPQAQTPCEKYSPAQRQFLRLLQTVNLGDEDEPVFVEVDQAEMITEALIDWLDRDSEITGFGGAESDYYEQLTPPASIANGEMVSVSELQVIKGMTPPLYRALLPSIVALPKETAGKLNINTAKASVIRTLTSVENCDLLPLPEQEGAEIAQIIQAGNYETIEDLADDPGLPATWLGKDNNLIFDQGSAGMFQSTYFLFFSEVGIGDDYVRRGKSIIKRVAGEENGVTIEVVRRTDGNF